MANVKQKGIFPPEILLEIFMLAIHNLPQYELLACALVCTSWYYCAMEIICPALQKSIYFNTNNMIQKFNTICSFEQMAHLNIMHQVPAVHIDTREFSAIYNNIVKILHPNCWAVIHIPFDNRNVELQRISNFLNSFEPGCRQQLTRLAFNTYRRPFVQSGETANALPSIMGQFGNLSEIYLEWGAQKHGIINIFTLSHSIRIVTITNIDPNGIRDLATVFKYWPSLQKFTLIYPSKNCILSPIINSLAESCQNLSSLAILADPEDGLKTALVKLINVCGKKLTRFVLPNIDLGNEIFHTLVTLTPNLEELDISLNMYAMDGNIPCGLWSKLRIMRLDYPYECMNIDWLLGILTNCSGLEYDMLLSVQIERESRIMEALQKCTHKTIDFNYWIPEIVNLDIYRA